MIVGNGLLGKAFEIYRNNENVLIFCSGVSNSRELDETQFEREINLIEKYIHTDKRFVYFSTVSVVDGSESSSYINHKRRIEKLITENHKNYLIFRLPIIVGDNANKVTFFNSIKNKIKNNETIDVYNVNRYLIDIDHLSLLLPKIIDNELESCMTINVCFDNFSSVSEIVDKMLQFMNGKSQKKFLECKPNHKVDNQYFKDKISIDIDLLKYNDLIIQKYCS